MSEIIDETIRTICIDLDDTISNYGGWHNEGFAVITGEPLPGAREAIEQLRENGYRVVVHSVRCGYPGGREAIVKYLVEHNIIVDEVCDNKPLALLYIDDKAITFEGDWADTLDKIQNFRHWKRPEGSA